MNQKLLIYVAPQGNGCGSLASPFGSIADACAHLSRINPGGTGEITICLRAGTYYLNAPIVLLPEGAGGGGRSVTLTGGEGETVVISGGRRINGAWEPWQNGIFRCVVDDRALRTQGFSQLYINGRRQIRARFPNVDPGDPVNGGYALPAQVPMPWPATTLQYAPETFSKKHWLHPEEAVLHIFPNSYWGNLQWQVTSADFDRHTLQLGRGGFQINEVMQGAAGTALSGQSKFYVENVFEELDSPGEWYFDRRDGYLYFMPPAGLDLHAAVVEASLLKQLFELRGSEERPVENITFRDVIFAHTEPTYLDVYEAPSLGDWSIHRGGAVFLEGTKGCAVKGCRFDALGGNGVFLSGHNTKCVISGNTFEYLGDSAVCLVGHKQLTLGSNHAYPFANTVSDNWIHDIGVYGKQTAGIFISVSRDNLISHNTIYNVPRAGICINDGTWGGHIIEFNDIHDTVRETGDHGPFNSWGRDRHWCLEQSHGPASHRAGHIFDDAQQPTLIRNNRFADDHGWGIDLDDGSSNYIVRDNLCIGISIKLREGDFRTVENNIFMYCANPPGFHIGYEENSDRFVRNIVYVDTRHGAPEDDVDFKNRSGNGEVYTIIGPPRVGSILKEMDHNLFFSDVGEFRATVISRTPDGTENTYTLGQWQALGYDEHSLFADPGFINPQQGDFRLRPDSPAFALGFREFDVTSFGAREHTRLTIV